MLIGKHFREVREAMGLSEAQVPQRIGSDFQESLLWDFEGGDDNDIDGWSVQDFKAYCNVLNVAPTDYIDIPIQDLQQLPLHELVQKRRQEMGLTITELSDLIGYEESVIETLEGVRSDAVVCMNALKETSLWLDIPFRILLSKL
jgi:transcriptional regulator with XRE-family HTH domain